MRLTLVKLSILRTLPMARTVYVALLLAVFTAASAGADVVHHVRTHRTTASAKTSHHSAITHRARRSVAHTARRRTTHTTAYRHESSYAERRLVERRIARRRREWAAHYVETHLELRRSTSYETREQTRETLASPLRTGDSPAADTRDAETSDLETRTTEPRREELRTDIPAAGTETADNPDDDTSRADATPDIPTHTAPAAEPDLPPISTSGAGLSLRSTRIVPLPPLFGSHASLVRQNERNDAEGLERIENDADLSDRIARGMLVPVPVSDALTVNANLPENRRYCRPWTAAFLTDLARAHEAMFHRPLQVNSAVRTVDYQRRLMEINGNAAPAEGEIASPHETGASIDIAKDGLTLREIYWMRDRLLRLQNEGKIDVEEEFQQACFHITVYETYLPAGSLRRDRLRRVSAPPPAADEGASNSAQIAAHGR